MSKEPRPDEDEKWGVEEELEVEQDGGEIEEQDKEGPFGLTRRQTVAGAGLAILGLGGIAVAASEYNWGGGDAPNGTEATPVDGDGSVVDNQTLSPTPTVTSTKPPTSEPTPADSPTPEPDPVLTPYPTSSPEPTPTPDEDLTYQIQDVTVDLKTLDPIFEGSEVEIGVQFNGNLVAWNRNVEIEDENGNTYNPLYRFRSDLFPDRQFYDVGEPHPVEEIYQDLDTDIEEMSEGMVKVFYDEEKDEGTWEDHREYKPVNYDDLRDGLLEHSSLEVTQDYFFNRPETLEKGEGALEDEWKKLVRDGLEPENYN